MIGKTPWNTIERMKRALLFGSLAVLALSVIGLIYRISPLSKRTSNILIRVNVLTPAPNALGYQVSIENDSYLPVVIGRCETVSDAMYRDTVVGDAIQRWQPEDNSWKTMFARNECRTVPLGIIEAKFTRKLLWHGQQLHTAPFFANIGFRTLPFRRGDKIRFVVFTRTPREDSEGIASPAFTIE